MRIRTIKPEFWTNEYLSRLDDFTLLLAIGLLNYADDEGYFNANAGLIRAAIFPLRDSSGSIPVSVTNLSNLGYIKLYSCDDGRIYGHIVNFTKHQVINKPKKSKIKDLCLREAGLLDMSGTNTVSIRSGTGNREQGSGNRDQGLSAVAESPEVPESLALDDTPAMGPTVDEIYAAYPLKKARIDAIKAIRAAIKRGITPAELLSRVTAYATATAAWPNQDRRFIPHPATWFNRGSYEDDPKTWQRTINENNRTGGTSRHFSNQPTYEGVTDR